MDGNCYGTRKNRLHSYVANGAPNSDAAPIRHTFKPADLEIGAPIQNPETG